MMKKLSCEICGGSLTIQAGGNLAVCNVCGIEYSKERLREMVDTPIPGVDDLMDLWKLAETYYLACDFDSALKTVKRVLEIDPSNERALERYTELQEICFFDIRNGELVKYNGRAKIVRVPGCVRIIGKGAFQNAAVQTVILPESIVEIGDDSFALCRKLESINLPFGVKRIGQMAFYWCIALKSISIPDSVEEIGHSAFSPSGLETVEIPPALYNYTLFCDSDGDPACPWETKKREQARRQAAQWKQEGRCPYCGGTLKGWWAPRCTNCGRSQ